jgi:hypothetical protein
MDSMTKYKIILLALLLATGFALFASLHSAWLMTSPLSAAQIARARHDCRFWLELFALSILLSVCVGSRMIWLHRKLQDKLSA